MSSETPSTHPAKAETATASRSGRVLSCVLCQQRKVKCDRSFPCGNCTKARVRCVPSTLTPRRRRRHFAERELLDRIHQYEGLLRSHGIAFEGLDSAVAEGAPGSHAVDGTASRGSQSPGARHESSTMSPGSSEAGTTTEAKDFWTVMNQGFRDAEDDSDDITRHRFPSQSSTKQLLERANRLNLQLLFAPDGTPADLSTLHPDPGQSFRLWQTYLDNVNPLLKVTHTPTLQSRIVAALGNLANIDRHLEVLMFGVYAAAVLSLDANECETMFGASKKDLLTKFQFACEQALINCDLLRSDSLECLTAFFLYLVVIRAEFGPRSTSSLLAVAVRTAERLGLNSEAANCRCNVVEAELRRRLWYSLVLFDARMSELSSHRTTTLMPIWDCAPPANVNDSELRVEMKTPPTAQRGPTEATLVAARGELLDFVRNSDFHLDFIAPALKALDRSKWQPVSPTSDSIAAVERHLIDTYLRHCTPENPLQLMVLMMVKSTLARYRVIRFYCQLADNSALSESSEGDEAFGATLDMIESDTQIMNSPQTKGFRWILEYNFPFLGYMLLVQMIKRTPTRSRNPHAWEVMSNNFEARFHYNPEDSPILNIFTKFILQAWRNYEDAVRAAGQEPEPPRFLPRIVQASELRTSTVPTASHAPDTHDMVTTMPLDSTMSDLFDLSTTDMSTLQAGAMFANPNGMWPMYGWIPPDGSLSW